MSDIHVGGRCKKCGRSAGYCECVWNSINIPQVTTEEQAREVCERLGLRYEPTGQDCRYRIWLDGRGSKYGVVWGHRYKGLESAVNYFLGLYWRLRKQPVITKQEQQAIRAICAGKDEK